jgi:hypothetical protein
MNTFGAGSRYADSCSEFYLQKDSNLVSLSLFSLEGEGITGALYVMSNEDYQVFGDIRG